ncbi:MAG: hypothetical protein J6T10_13460 [Methanobrevibacter sp.]|nr:hypothetical protein [Methanobrevibacter sp.]
MAISTVTLYKVGFRPEQNPCLDSIASYLGGLSPILTINNFQFVKHALDLTIKCEIYQDELASPSMNYVSIKNDIDSRTFYYYVRNVYWRSQNTLLLDLSMDTLNTFKDLISFTDNTQIKRMHKDRFIKPTGWVEGAGGDVYRRIDRIYENTPEFTKYKTADSIISGSTDKWYLIYCTNQNVSASDENKAVNCYLVPENDTTITNADNFYYLSTLLPTNKFGIILETGVTVEVNGSQYGGSYQYYLYLGNSNGTAVLGQINKVTGILNILGTFTMSSTFTTLSPCHVSKSIQLFGGVGDPAFCDTMDAEERLVVLDKLDFTRELLAGGDVLIAGIASVDRTLSYITKIIECPYEPLDIDDSITDGTIAVVTTNELSTNAMLALQLKDIATEFEFELPEGTLYDFKETIPPVTNTLVYNKKLSARESKLLNSAYYNLNLLYDSFSKTIPCENVTPNQTDNVKMKVIYKQSNAISSNLLFKYQLLNASQINTDNVENFLVCGRNNEYPIFNASYLNYLRNGYNYDQKAKNLALEQSAFNASLNLLGAGASFATAGATGNLSVVPGVSLLTSSLSSISNLMYSQLNAENNIERTKAQQRANASTVSGSDDLNLLNYYLKNKLHVSVYQVTTEIRTQLYELFFKCGYATYESGTPNTTSRKRFNYLECEAEFSTRDNPVWKDFINDVIERFRIGVTFFHTYDDFLQEKENWETWV